MVNNMFNNNAISVSELWSKFKQPAIKELYELNCNRAKKIEIENLKKDKLKYIEGRNIFSNGLSLLLLDEYVDCASYLIDSSVIILEKINVSENLEDEKIINTVAEKYQNTSLAIACGKRLEFYVSLACAKSINTLEEPKKDILEKEIIKLNSAYKLYTGNLGYSERQDSVLASIVSLLVGRYDISLELLDRCKKYKEMKYHRQILRKITVELIKNSKHTATILDANIESDFFELFNAYRVPMWFQTKKALNETPVLKNPLGNYMFSWLYLKLFKGHTESTWDELRDIMMS
jgi:hypothetical protein